MCFIQRQIIKLNQYQIFQYTQLYYAEACNEFAFSASMWPGNTASFEEMSQWW